MNNKQMLPQTEYAQQTRKRGMCSPRCWIVSMGAAAVVLLVMISGRSPAYEQETTEAEDSFLAKAHAMMPKLPFDNPLACPAPAPAPPLTPVYDHVVTNTPNVTAFDKLNILHFIDFTTYDSVMDRWFARSQADFALATDLIGDAPVWGVGFPGYDEKKTLVENVEARFGRKDYFHAVLPYYNGDQINWLGIDPVPVFWEVRELSTYGTIVIDRPHEMRDDRRVPIIDHANVSIVLCPYANECYEYKEAYERSVLLVHQPHPVNIRLFQHPIRQANGKAVQRARDVILAGSLEAPLYPLRHRLGQMIEEDIIPGYIRPHPGYPDIFPEEKRIEMGVNVAYLDKQLQDFSDDLGSAKICFVTASRWGYSVQKYGEAAAAGCLIIGTIPFDRQEDMREFVVEISNNDTDAKIASTIQYWLDPKQERARLARTEKAQNYFVQKFSGRRYVEDVLMWVRLARRGQKGMILPYQWSPLPDPLPMDG